MAVAPVRHDLVLDHLRLAARLAAAYRGRGVDADDLEQVARLALVKAAAGFDASLGAFPAFATATIRGELKRYFRDRAWGVRPPRRIQELQARLSAETSGDITSSDIPSLAARLGEDPADVSEAAAARGCFTPDSLDASTDAGHETGATDDRIAFVDDWVAFCHASQELSLEQRQLLAWRFVDDLTQQEIANRLGISQMQVSRRLSRLLSELRTAMTEPAAA